MRNLFVVAGFMALSLFSVMANDTGDFKPILKEGRKWLTRIDYNSYNDDKAMRYWFYVDKDTVINGTDAKKILCEPAEDYDVVNVEKRFYASESNGILTGYYPYPDPSLGPDDTRNYIWYPEPVLDLNCEIGDKFGSMGDLLTVSKDKITAHGFELTRVRLEVDGVTDAKPVYWVEEMGASDSRGWIFKWQFKPTGGTPGSSNNAYVISNARMISVEEIYDDDVCIFTANDFSEGDTLGITDVSSEEIDTAIYDIYGIPVTSPQPGSLYIRNGKKIIWRGQE